MLDVKEAGAYHGKCILYSAIQKSYCIYYAFLCRVVSVLAPGEVGYIFDVSQLCGSIARRRVLCCAVGCCGVLWCAVGCCAVGCCGVLWFGVVWCGVLWWSV